MKKDFKKVFGLVSFIMGIFLIFIFVSSQGLMSTTTDLQNKKCANPSYFYRATQDVCVGDYVINYNCESGYILYEPTTITECNKLGGIWDECPQCRKGYICPTSVCKPMCNIGQNCQLKPALLEKCESKVFSDGTCYPDGEKVSTIESLTSLGKVKYSCPNEYYKISNHICLFKNTKLVLCEEGETFNLVKEVCEVKYEPRKDCDGELKYDIVTLKDKCFNNNFLTIYTPIEVINGTTGDTYILPVNYDNSEEQESVYSYVLLIVGLIFVIIGGVFLVK